MEALEGTVPRVEIHIRGHLDPRWSERLGGLAINHSSNGTTVLAGTVQDQPALRGLIAMLGNLNLDLLSVTTENAPETRPERR